MTRRAYLYFVLTFLLGVILGGVGVYYYLWQDGRIFHPDVFNKARAEEHLKKELNLTDSQLGQIDKIFDEMTAKLSVLQKQVDPEFQAVHYETRARIRQILDSDQAKRFDEYLKQMDERRRKRGLPSPPAR
jgi:Spy/CpxP family protein refolding chaperone